jgi:hypothetical protein
MRRRFLAWLYWRSTHWENGRPPFRVFYRTFDEMQRKREADDGAT